MNFGFENPSAEVNALLRELPMLDRESVRFVCKTLPSLLSIENSLLFFFA
jgi:hypothetical protein